MANRTTEQSPLLQSAQSSQSSQHESATEVWCVFVFASYAKQYAQVVDFTKWDEENPRNWSRTRKMVNVVIVACMARTSSCDESLDRAMLMKKS